MRKFFTQWWKMLVGLVAGYAIGTLVIVSRPVDYGMVLKYLSAFLSFPTAIIIIFSILILVYKEEFRRLISRMQGFKAAGFEGSFAAAKLELQQAVLVNEVIAAQTEPEKKELESLEGEEREVRAKELAEEELKLRKRLNETIRKSRSLSLPSNSSVVELIRASIQDSISESLIVNFPNYAVSMTAENEANLRSHWVYFKPEYVAVLLMNYSHYRDEFGTATFNDAVENAFEHYISARRSQG